MLTVNAVTDALKQGAETVFLLTEKDSYLEGFYSKLGFKTEYLGKGYAYEE